MRCNNINEKGHRFAGICLRAHPPRDVTTAWIAFSVTSPNGGSRPLPSPWPPVDAGRSDLLFGGTGYFWSVSVSCDVTNGERDPEQMRIIIHSRIRIGMRICAPMM
ncbi:hypothetical protein TNCV_1048341 [Trichonephila clavipes]|nr:hypothetical protein TNCV_1048341 [Trichonephila clavipes]